MKTRNKGTDKKAEEKPMGHKNGQGSMGAGKSGKENMGSEKPTTDENFGSQKAGGGSKNGSKK